MGDRKLDEVHSYRRNIIVATALWSLWALSVLPLAVLLGEFGVSLGECERAAWYYAKLYGHFFVFPITFGLLAVVFLTTPWTHTVNTIRGLPSPRRGRVITFLGASVVVIVAFASWAEFTKATPAIWSFKAAATNFPTASRSEGNADVIHKGLAALAKRCGCETQECRQGKGAPANGKPATKPPLSELQYFEGERSYTEWAYYVGFIANTTWMALLFGVVVMRAGSNDRSQGGLTLAAMALATAWVPFRASFLWEKQQLYEADPLLPLNFLIFLGFIVLHMHMFRLQVLRLDDRKQQVVLGAGNLIVGVLALLSASIGSLAKSNTGWLADGGHHLVSWFGSQSSLLVYITMLLLVLAMIAPDVIRRLLRGDDGGQEIRSSSRGGSSTCNDAE